MNENIIIWEREVGKHRAEGDKNKWQADIYWENQDHHGIGETPSEALAIAATRWHIHTIKKARAALEDKADE